MAVHRKVIKRNTRKKETYIVPGAFKNAALRKPITYKKRVPPPGTMTITLTFPSKEQHNFNVHGSKAELDGLEKSLRAGDKKTFETLGIQHVKGTKVRTNRVLEKTRPMPPALKKALRKELYGWAELEEKTPAPLQGKEFEIVTVELMDPETGQKFNHTLEIPPHMPVGEELLKGIKKGEIRLKGFENMKVISCVLSKVSESLPVPKKKKYKIH